MNLLMLGASVRSLMSSAVYSGFDVYGVDLFSDWDVGQMAVEWPENRVFGEQVSRKELALGGIDVGSFDGTIVSGGFENQLTLVREIEQRGCLLGPRARDLAGLQDSVELMSNLHRRGIQTPASKRTLAGNDNPENWIFKIDGACGGHGIRLANAEDKHAPSLSDSSYFQARIEGESVSALFVSMSPGDEADSSRITRLLGVTRQMVGEQGCGAAPFCYCGSIGPLRFSNAYRAEIEFVGKYIADDYRMAGVWGVDFIVNHQGVWPIDINPRIPASAELFESSLQVAEWGVRGIVELHVGACQATATGHRLAPAAELSILHPRGLVEGKAILFNRLETPLTISESVFWQFRKMYDPKFFRDRRLRFTLADIPRAGVVVPPGAPVLTIRIRSHNEREATVDLESRARAIFAIMLNA